MTGKLFDDVNDETRESMIFENRSTSTNPYPPDPGESTDTF